ncbi:MAG TPA: DUF2203 family protein [Vicinamibacteria bacterium]|jgi:hypothetical protein
MTERDVARKTIFTYDEAAALLPEIRELTEEAWLKVEALGTGADDRVQRIVVAWAEAMIAKGLEVKGLWLVDFDNGSGYYCWKYPETGLLFYHSYEDGFGGRVRIQ